MHCFFLTLAFLTLAFLTLASYFLHCFCILSTNFGEVKLTSLKFVLYHKENYKFRFSINTE